MSLNSFPVITMIVPNVETCNIRIAIYQTHAQKKREVKGLEIKKGLIHFSDATRCSLKIMPNKTAMVAVVHVVTTNLLTPKDALSS